VTPDLYAEMLAILRRLAAARVPMPRDCVRRIKAVLAAEGK
jgi:hypothetical protein